MSVHWCVCVCMCVCVVVYTRACQREHARRESKKMPERERQREFAGERVSERVYKVVLASSCICPHVYLQAFSFQILHEYSCAICIYMCVCVYLRLCTNMFVFVHACVRECLCMCVQKKTRHHTHSTNPSPCHTHAVFTISHPQLGIWTRGLWTRGLPTFNHQYLTAEFPRLSESTMHLHHDFTVYNVFTDTRRTRQHFTPSTYLAYAHEFCRFVMIGTEWRRPIECLKLQIIFGKRATDHRSFLQKITYEDKASYACSSPCIYVHYSSWAV